jgi:hypothetical protein
MTITSRMPRHEYDAIDALNISRLKEIKRSPQHYRHSLENPRKSDALKLGTATHTATLEPERYENDFCVWDRVTDSGAMAPRRGQHWDAFCVGSRGRTILTPDENRTALAIAMCVRGNELAMRYLESGDPEVTIEWRMDESLGGRPARSRVDWITTVDGVPYVVGFKTARDCRHFAFGAQSAKLAYHWQWAFYFDAFVAARGVAPRMVEIVAESAAPHAVAVYRIPDDIIEQGREEYWAAAKLLAECERTNEWPGPQPTEEFLSLPSWVYQAEEDLTDIGLEIDNE